MKNFLTNIKMFLSKNRYTIILVLVLLILDQATKIFFDGKIYNIIDGVFSFTSSYNTGAGCSILSGHTWLLIVFSILFLAFIFVFNHFQKNKTKVYIAGYSLIVAGAFGNLIDRLCFGYVRDFISVDLINFPIFNIADICLTIGVMLMCVHLIFFEYNKKNKKDNLQSQETKE